MRALVAFVVLAYGTSWCYWLALVAGGATVERGDAWPTQVPGLFGPLLAAVAVTAWCDGRRGLRALLRSAVRWRWRSRWYAATLAPLAFLAVAVVVESLVSGLPPASDIGAFSGLPHGLGWVLLAAVPLALGEEVGWRGFALPRLLVRHGRLRATLLVAAMWAGWHLPLFVLLASYGSFQPLILPGFFIGLAAGSAVLTSIYAGTGGSVLATSLWHASYNVAVATAAADGVIAPLVTAAVIAWGVGLVGRWRASATGSATPWRERAAGRPPSASRVRPRTRG